MLDPYGFLTLDVPGEDYVTHRPLLLKALLEVGGPVLELGIGPGSTPCLHAFCHAERRELQSWDSRESWYREFSGLADAGHIFGCCYGDWDSSASLILKPRTAERWGVVLVDHAPGERRIVDIARLAEHAEVLVIHDTQPFGSAAYGYEAIWPLFSYRCDDPHPAAWTTAVSSSVRVNTWQGQWPLKHA